MGNALKALPPTKYSCLQSRGVDLSWAAPAQEARRPSRVPAPVEINLTLRGESGRWRVHLYCSQPYNEEGVGENIERKPKEHRVYIESLGEAWHRAAAAAAAASIGAQEAI